VCGETGSTSGIATLDAHQATKGGSFDGYFGRFKPDGTLMNASYYGGAGSDRLSAIAVTPLATIHVAGWSQSSSNIATPGAHSTSNQGAGDGFFATFCTTQEAWITTTLETCAGAADGSIAVQLTGGTLLTSITLNGTQVNGNSALFTGLGSGVPGMVTPYNLSFTSSFGSCSGGAPPVTILMYGPPVLTISLLSVFVTCPGTATGGMNASITGGTPPYTYQWSTGASTMNITGLVAGTYDLQVTDANGCTSTASGTVTELPPIIPTVAAVQVPLCHGELTGSIDLEINGGTPPITYQWSNGAQVQDPAGLGAGVYTVLVTDQFGCEATTSATIVPPPALLLTVSVTNETMGNDGAIDLQVSGGTPPYTYAWSNGSTGQDLEMLVGGTYSVEVTDANGCTEVVQVSVNSFVGLEELGPGPQWTVALDGGAQLLTVSSDTPFNAVELLDASGRIIVSESRTGLNTSMAVGHLSSAVYIVRLSYGTFTHHERLFIGH
jgi:hypothetical protein